MSDSARLILQQADGGAQEFELPERGLVIGRDPACDIYIENRFISRQHARLEPTDRTFALVELGGRNPVHVNGQRVDGSRVLTSGDVIGIADIVLEFQAAEEDPLATAVFTAPAPSAARAPAGPAPVAPNGGTGEVAGSLSRSDLRRIHSLLGSRGTLTIMFTDLVNSTQRTRGLGDERAQEYLRTHNSLLRGEFARHGGYEVKGYGDGFMVAFTSTVSGLKCAVAIQRSVARYSAEHTQLPIEVRIGLNVGEVISEEDDFFGTAVILAARIASSAGSGEILVSELVRSVAAPAGEFVFEHREPMALKGFAEEQRLYGVEWAEAEDPAGP